MPLLLVDRVAVSMGNSVLVELFVEVGTVCSVVPGMPVETVLAVEFPPEAPLVTE